MLLTLHTQTPLQRRSPSRAAEFSKSQQAAQVKFEFQINEKNIVYPKYCMGYTKTKKFCCWFGIQISPGVLCFIWQPYPGQKPLHSPVRGTAWGWDGTTSETGCTEQRLGSLSPQEWKPGKQAFQSPGPFTKSPQAKMGQGVACSS